VQRQLRYIKYKVAKADQFRTWRHVSFAVRSPATGCEIGSRSGSVNGDETYEGVTGLACRQVHMVNPKTGKALGADEKTWLSCNHPAPNSRAAITERQKFSALLKMLRAGLT
jgi:hypothetical protein